MERLLLQDLPRYECLREYARRYPGVDPSATEAFLHLLRTSTDLGDTFAEFFTAHGISQGRFTVLMLLNRHPETPVHLAELAERSGCTRATMTGLIDGLERDGLVARQPDPQDRRMFRVCLTAAGRALLETIAPDYFRRVATLLEPLGESDRRSLMRVLGKLQAGLAHGRPARKRGANAPGVLCDLGVGTELSQSSIVRHP